MKYIRKFNEEFFHFDDETFDDETFDDEQPKLDYNNPNFDKIVELLERDCKPFLDEVSSKDIEPIFRGTYVSQKEEVDNLGLYKKVVRTDRKALDTNKEISNMFDDEFEKKFGVRPRSSGIFTTKKYGATSAYGARYIFIPIGDYQYFWNPKCDDLYTKINTESWYRRFTKPDLDKVYRDKSLVKRFYNFITNNNLEKEVDKSIKELVNGYKDNGLDDNTNQEIMFVCKEYYLLPTYMLEQYKKYLLSRK